MFELSQKQAEALYYLDGNEEKVNRLFYGGAAGGGKTLFGCAWQIERRIKYPGTAGLIGRKHLTDLKKSTLQTFNRVFHEHCRATGYTCTLNGQLNIIDFSNGSKIFLGDLASSPNDPMYERFGGWELSDAFIDEAGECPEMAVNTIYSRIRFNLINERPSLLLCSNPSQGWLKNKWIKEKNGKPVKLPDNWVYVRAKLVDNPDIKFREQYEKTLLEMPSSQRDRLLYGDWDFMSNETPYYNDFNYDINVIEDFTPVQNLPLVISFDFNYDPCSLVISQTIKQKGGGLITFEEMQEVGGTRPLALRLKKWLDENWKGAIRITGDASGHKKDSRSGSKTDFDIIQEVLQLPSGFINYNNRRNEALGYSRDIINTLFFKKLWKIKSNCVGLLQDVQTAKPKGDGGEFIKDRDNNKLDLLDAGRYYVHNEIADISDIEVLKLIVNG